MAKKRTHQPLVTSLSTTLKKTIHNEDTQVVTSEELKTKKKEMMTIVESALDVFKSNLTSGKVTMTTSADLERLVKLTLLISGEADSRVGKPFGESEEEVTTTLSNISMSKVETILNLEDPEVKKMYDRLYEGYNEANDLEE